MINVLQKNEVEFKFVVGAHSRLHHKRSKMGDQNLETYEESRQKRMEENKRRMEELNINKLAVSLRPQASSPNMKRKAKPRVPVDMSVVRRSSRVRDMPPPVYKDIPIEPLGRARSYGSSKRRNLSDRVYASDEDREYARQKAEELQSSLGSAYPCFVKPMLQSHVTGGFWLGLPQWFCKYHLSKYDETMLLVDEDQKEWYSKYLPRKNGLSGGWMGFAVAHKLVDGDALVFQLVKPTEFKVFIVRANQPDQVDNDTWVVEEVVKRKRTRACKK